MDRPKELECMTCHKTWVASETRDEWCDTCFNPHHESGRVRGCQTNIECTVNENFGATLDAAMNAEWRRQEAKQKRRRTTSSGHYDADGAPPCSSCDGSGKTRSDAPLDLATLRRAVEELLAKGPPPCRVLNEPVEVVAARIMARAEETGTDPLAVARVYMRPDSSRV